MMFLTMQTMNIAVASWNVARPEPADPGFIEAPRLTLPVQSPWHPIQAGEIEYSTTVTSMINSLTWGSSSSS
jgi:hypothetical protein